MKIKKKQIYADFPLYSLRISGEEGGYNKQRFNHLSK